VGDDDLRIEALRRAVRENPGLAAQSDDESKAQLMRIAAAIEDRLRVDAELAQARRLEFAEQARLAGEIARQERVDAQAKAEEAEKARRLEYQLRHREYLDSLPSWRRWMVTHRSLAFLLALSLGAALVASLVAVVVAATQARQAEATAQATAEEQARIESERQASEAAEREFQERLPAACDPSIDERRIPPNVWIDWLGCSDPAVAAEAAFWLLDDAEILLRRENYGLIMKSLARVVTESDEGALISRISDREDIDLSVHEEIVQRWGPEVVPSSFRIVYEQLCSSGMEPETYLGGTQWSDGLGNSVEFNGDLCTAIGFTVGGRQVSSVPRSWSQDYNEVVIGKFHYELDGSTLKFLPDATGKYLGEPPLVLTRID